MRNCMFLHDSSTCMVLFSFSYESNPKVLLLNTFSMKQGAFLLPSKLLLFFEKSVVFYIK